MSKLHRGPDGKLPAFTSYGSQTVLYTTARVRVLCAACATEAIDTGDDDPPVRGDAFDEGEALECEACGASIASTYGPAPRKTEPIGPTGRGLSFEDALTVHVSREQARREIERHGSDFADFVAECGDRETYPGTEVLAWLGY